MKISILATAVAGALASALPASAVYLNTDGTGQALIFPYYTAQSSGTNPFNTYLTVVNHTGDAKALRVRFRESRNSREVASFNLFLSPNDAWAGAVVPAINVAQAPRVSSSDRSCISPPFVSNAGEPGGLNLQAAFYTGAFADGNGEGLDRTREGWVEVIEMATLTGASAAAVTHNSSGVPANCATVQGTPSLLVGAPTGGLSGTLTLINVASGMDFTVNADALAGLGTRPFLRPANDQYPDLGVNEIDPASTVAANGFIYRSTWARPIDAVSATLMRSQALTEYVLDAGTASKTDVVITFPTRNNYMTTSSATLPFTAAGLWAANCVSSNAQGSFYIGETVDITAYDREEASTYLGHTDFNEAPSAPRFCAAASIISFSNGAAYQVAGAVGSLSRGFSAGGFFSAGAGPAAGIVPLPAAFQNGWARFTLYPAGSLTSLTTSTRMNLATGATTTGSHVFTGLPMTGLTLRTFENGTLTCGAGSCQGNYGGSFPLKFQRSISPAN